MAKLIDISKGSNITELNDRDKRVCSDTWRAHAVARENLMERDFYDWRMVYRDHLVGLYNVLLTKTENDNKLSFPDFCRFMYYTADVRINKYGNLKRILQ
jgi:hypothetical protein